MALCPGDTTQWEDIQRRLGNFEPKPREVPEHRLAQALVDAVEQLDPLAHCSLEELREREDDVDDDVLGRYRRQRLAELKAKEQAARFGDVRQVCRTNFVAEVTEASAAGQWVVTLLYLDAIRDCHPLLRLWPEVARRFPAVKFLRGVAEEVVPGFPESSAPTVLLYRDRDCQRQLVGLGEWGGARCSAEAVEWVLAKAGVVESDLEEDPRQEAGSWRRLDRPRRGRSDSGSEEEEERGDDRCYGSLRADRVLRSR